MRPPVTFDPLTILLEHNRWATARVLELCGRLSSAQFHQRFDIGPGSLHDTLTHIVGCMRRWSDRVAGVPIRPSIERLPAQQSQPGEPADRTPAELARLLDAAHAEIRLTVESCRADLGRPVDLDLGGTGYTFTRGAALTHVRVHGTHHRAQCLNMLRRRDVVGLSHRLPDLDVIDWQHETECLP